MMKNLVKNIPSLLAHTDKNVREEVCSFLIISFVTSFVFYKCNNVILTGLDGDISVLLFLDQTTGN